MREGIDEEFSELYSNMYEFKADLKSGITDIKASDRNCSFVLNAGGAIILYDDGTWGYDCAPYCD